jgi:Holliday junction resolvase RusA-like endonuclease
MTFTIPCVPPTVTSQMKGACRTPGGVRFFKKKPVAQAENTLFALLRPHVPAEPLLGPLRMTVGWRMPWRKSETKKRMAAGSQPCDVRPDLSNLIKLLEDCMTTLRFWNDDSQICDLRLTKHWSDNPGITIGVESINP